MVGVRTCHIYWFRTCKLKYMTGADAAALRSSVNKLPIARMVALLRAGPAARMRVLPRAMALMVTSSSGGRLPNPVRTTTREALATCFNVFA